MPLRALALFAISALQIITHHGQTKLRLEVQCGIGSRDTTYPVLQVWDGTTGAEVGSYSTTFSSGTNFYTQVTGSSNVASGHPLRFKITTAAAGCTTNAGAIVATITYQMQN